MVRKVEVHGIIDCAGPEVIFDILYGSDKFMKRYHKKINCDPHAEASSWNKNHEREVKYIALSDAPKMITKLIGESFPVKETQKYVKHGDCYTITCSPRIDSPSGERVRMHGETVLVPHASGGCAITSYMTLECKGGLWGLVGAIESFMESKAKTGFELWLTIAKNFCQERLAISGGHEIDDKHECFFDAQDVLGDDVTSADTQMPDHPSSVNSILHSYKTAFSASMENTHAMDLFFMQTVLREVTDVHRSCDVLKGHVEKFNSKMLKMEGDLTHVRLALERHHAGISKRKQLTLLGAGFAAGFGIGYLYLRMKRQT